ncbi:hypothetical protein PFY01_02480 [Brevundimonas vesicularis]|uniref:hypothetical protein n=1 Tax=Brevundimonas vesicularis TaxID=41276 RepID=UPI0022EC33C5|nr:hypothetical protein [Brevundimonas vesicularis]WBT06562.1 hypothetical protein PFY01_02480 [Brevundimonas vesicularis]
MAEGGLTVVETTTPTTGGALHWPPDKFRYDMREADARERVQRMDIAGRARALVWGPYEVLTPGLWRATARFAVDRWACRHTYRLEWGATADYSLFEFTPHRPGVFEVSADRLWREAEKAELRIILTEGALGGTFELLGANITSISG